MVQIADVGVIQQSRVKMTFTGTAGQGARAIQSGDLTTVATVQQYCCKHHSSERAILGTVALALALATSELARSRLLDSFVPVNSPLANLKPEDSDFKHLEPWYPIVV
jgi:hypothetical protein